MDENNKTDVIKALEIALQAIRNGDAYTEDLEIAILDDAIAAGLIDDYDDMN